MSETLRKIAQDSNRVTATEKKKKKSTRSPLKAGRRAWLFARSGNPACQVWTEDAAWTEESQRDLGKQGQGQEGSGEAWRGGHAHQAPPWWDDGQTRDARRSDRQQWNGWNRKKVTKKAWGRRNPPFFFFFLVNHPTSCFDRLHLSLTALVLVNPSAWFLLLVKRSGQDLSNCCRRQRRSRFRP